MSMFSDHAEDIATLKVEIVKIHPVTSTGLTGATYYDSPEIRFYKIGDLGYTMCVYDKEGQSIADIVLNPSQIDELILKAEIIR